MLLSPIFLALGSVATQRPQRRGPLRGGRDRADRLQPRDHRRRPCCSRPTLGVDGLAIGVVAGSLAHVLVQLPPLRARRLPLRPAHRPAATRRLAGADADGAAGDRSRRDADHVHRHDVPRLDALGVGAVSRFNIAFTLLQIPIGIIGVPLGSCCCPSLSRDAAVGRDRPFADLLSRGLRLLSSS